MFKSISNQVSLVKNSEFILDLEPWIRSLVRNPLIRPYCWGGIPFGTLGSPTVCALTDCAPRALADSCAMRSRLRASWKASWFSKSSCPKLRNLHGWWYDVSLASKHKKQHLLGLGCSFWGNQNAPKTNAGSLDFAGAAPRCLSPSIGEVSNSSWSEQGNSSRSSWGKMGILTCW